jgi:pimeloyl-ACP methyl ester carboxylesterase
MIEAMVQTGPFETSYRRAGAGDAVLLLIGPTEAEAGDWLFSQLARRFRITAPVVPVGLDGDSDTDRPGVGGGLEGWLRGLIDGLGLERAALVAGAARGADLLRFTALDPERVGRLALVQPVVSGGMAPADVVLGDPGRADPHPVLIMGLPEPDDRNARLAALDRLVRFLAASP